MKLQSLITIICVLIVCATLSANQNVKNYNILSPEDLDAPVYFEKFREIMDEPDWAEISINFDEKSQQKDVEP